jgi:hypothetical protein
MEMSIAAASVGLSQFNAQQDIGVSVLKKEMNSMAEGVTDILPNLSQAMGIGANLDIGA